jgi:hypothetical protein
VALQHCLTETYTQETIIILIRYPLKFLLEGNFNHHQFRISKLGQTLTINILQQVKAAPQNICSLIQLLNLMLLQLGLLHNLGLLLQDRDNSIKTISKIHLFCLKMLCSKKSQSTLIYPQLLTRLSTAITIRYLI